MISAKQAHDLADGQNNEAHNAEIKKCEEAIKRAAADGRFETVMSNLWLRDSVTFALEGLGYDVKRNSCQREGSWTTIRWKNQNAG